ncbi:hypothetical protein CSC02_2483 [Enterobacter hormaechei subsp. hoffmannii]|nr:hypothetical protein CSC02_2483 [Enterobacter hormaechei subsp. hoffmannii]
MLACSGDLSIGSIDGKVNTMTHTDYLDRALTILNIYRAFDICTTIIF